MIINDTLRSKAIVGLQCTSG